MRRAPALLAAAAALSVLLTACGGGDEASTAGSSASAAFTGFDVSSVQKDDEVAALLPAEVADDGVLTVGMDTSYAPADFLAEDGTTPIGYDVDIAKALGAVLGVQVQIQSADFAGIIPAIGSKYDIGVSSFTIRADREEQVNMISYFQAGEAYAVQAGNPKGVDGTDLCGLTVGVQTGTVEDDELTAVMEQCAADGKDAIEPLRYEAQSDVTTALVGGKADIMWADSPIIAYAVSQTGGKLEQLGEPFASAPQGIVVAKDDEALTKAVQAAMQKLIDDGVYGDILAAWGNEAGAVTTAELNPTVE